MHGQGIEGYFSETTLQSLLNPGSVSSRNRLGGAAYGTKGSPMIFEDFTKGNIYYSSRSMTTGTLINYNCYTHEVLYSDGSQNYLLNPKEIDYLEFFENDTPVIFQHIFLKDLKKSLFVQVLYNTSSKLYKRHYRDFKEAEYGEQGYGPDRRYDEYINHYDFYISLDDGDAQLLKPKKKDLLDIMHTHAKEIEAFLKGEKIKLKSDKDLIKVVKYYDSLSTPSQ